MSNSERAVLWFLFGWWIGTTTVDIIFALLT
jgi:hypothetical protein